MFRENFAICIFVCCLSISMLAATRSCGETTVDSEVDDYKLVLEYHYVSNKSLINNPDAAVTAIKLTEENIPTLIPEIMKQQLTGCNKPYLVNQLVNQTTNQELLFLYCVSDKAVKSLYRHEGNDYFKLK